MLVNFKKVEIILENMDGITFENKYIGMINIEDVHKRLRRSDDGVYISKECIANEIFIEVFKDGNELYNSFYMRPNGLKMDKFKRLSETSDITSIFLYYDDNSNEEYYANGVFDEFDINLNQQSYISKLGNLYILISKEKISIENYIKKKFYCSIDDIFNNEEYNDRRKYNYNSTIIKYNEYSSDNLPNMYRYVYLKNDKTEERIAVRVYDKDSGWKFIFPKGEECIIFPKFWRYVDVDDITENHLCVNRKNIIKSVLLSIINDFKMEDILKRYPPFSLHNCSY